MKFLGFLRPYAIYSQTLKLSDIFMEKRVPITHPNAINLAVNCLKTNGVIAIPTDTVYGLACNACNSDAIKKLYDIKERCEYKPLAICLGEIDDLKKWAKINHLPKKLLKSLLPGPVTLVLECTAVLDKSLKPVSGKVGIRIPNNKFVRSLTKQIDFPLALTSANVSGKPSSLNVDEFETIWPLLSGIFDSGPLGNSDSQRAASTVIDLTAVGYYKILRYGINCDRTISILRKHGLTEAQ